jgi:hypothetical protein
MTLCPSKSTLGETSNETRRIPRMRRMTSDWLNKNKSLNTFTEIKRLRRMLREKLSA